MSDRLKVFESVLKKQADAWLATLESQGYSAVQVKVFRAIKDVTFDVYQVESGEESLNPVATIRAVVIGDAFFPSDSMSAGTMQEGWLFTTSPDIKVGDRVEIQREGVEKRRYKITSLYKIGTTVAIFKKYRLAALGD